MNFRGFYMNFAAALKQLSVNMSIDTDPQQQEAASPLMLVGPVIFTLSIRKTSPMLAFVVAIVIGLLLGGRVLGTWAKVAWALMGGVATSLVFTFLAHYLAPPNRIRFPLSEDLKLVPLEALVYAAVILFSSYLRNRFKRKGNDA